MTNLLGIKTPVVAPPMAGASGGLLAASVSRAGGFGFLAVGYDSPENVQRELDLARSTLGLPSDAPLPIGVGYLGWQLDKSEIIGQKLIDLALENRVQAIWLSFGDNLPRWAHYVRERDSNISLFVQVTSVEEATAAIRDCQPNVLVAQGNESGGHGSSTALPVRTLTPQILDLVKDKSPQVHVLAAGGFIGGADVLEMLNLGASGAVLGTRFLLTPESLFNDSQRLALLNATGSPTVRTMAFDHARGTLGWPEGIDGRALKNDTVIDFDAGEDISVIKTKFERAVQSGDPDRMLVWAGTGVAEMARILPAEQIVSEVHQFLNQHLSG